MTGSAPLQVDVTGQLAASVSGPDPTPLITAGDKGLADFLATPTQQLLTRFELHQPSSPAVAAPSAAQQHPGGNVTPIDPTQLISPVAQALSTLGSGMNPASMVNGLSGISNAFEGTAGPLQQALSAVQQGWQGATSTAAANLMNEAVANGAQVAAQATELGQIATAATAQVAQARAQLIAIINEFLATLAAIGPNIIFPWGWAAVVAAASHAVTQSAAVMAETQGALAAQAAAATEVGAPVSVASTPTAAAAAASPLGSLLGSSTDASTLSSLSPLLSLGAMAISPALSAVGMASSAGGAGSSAAAAPAATLAGSTGAAPASAGGGAALAGKAGAAGVHVSPAGGGAGASGSLVSRLTAPTTTTAPESAATVTAAATTRSGAGISTGTGAMMGGAPMAGPGQAAGNGGSYTAASYLQSSGQGGKLVGESTTVPPPVIGEVDLNDSPDIELQI